MYFALIRKGVALCGDPFFFLRYKNGKGGNNAKDYENIRLFNTVGQLISTTDVKGSVTILHLNELPNGIYFVQIYNGNELITTGKVVKR